MAVSLISMNKDEAQVAEGVTTYRRAEIEEQLSKLKQDVEIETGLVNQYQQDIARLTQETEKAKARLEVNAYKLELFLALKEAFDRDYPVAQAEQPVAEQPATEQPAAEEAPAETTSEEEHKDVEE